MRLEFENQTADGKATKLPRLPSMKITCTKMNNGIVKVVKKKIFDV